MKQLILSILLCSKLFLVGCQSPTPENPSIPIVIPAEFSSITLGDNEVHQKANFTTNAQWNITLTESKNTPSWLGVTPMSGGPGENSITITADKNLGFEKRSAQVVINSSEQKATIIVTQEAASRSLSIDILSKNVTSSSNSFTIDLTSNTKWSTTDVPQWITLTPSSGEGDTQVAVEYLENDSTTPREAKLKFEAEGISEEFTLTQAGKVVETILELDSVNRNVSDIEGEFTLSLRSNTTWHTDNVPQWITLTPSSGEGDTQVAVEYLENDSTTPREAKIKFEAEGISEEFTLTQAGKVVQATLELDFANKNVSDVKGEFALNLRSNTTWHTDNVPQWITLTPSSGEGDTQISVEYQKNDTEEARSTTIKFIAGELTQSLNIVQQGATPQSNISEVEFTSTIVPADGAAVSQFTNGDIVAVTSYHYPTGQEVSETVSYYYSNGHFVSDSPIEFDQSKQQLLHYASYPYNKGINFTFNVATDQSNEATYKSCDLMSAIVNATDNPTPQLVFHHRLNNLKLTLSSSEVNLNGARVAFFAKTQTLCDISKSLFSATGTTNEVLPLSSDNGIFNAFVAPQTIGEGAKFIVVTVGEKEYIFSAPNDIVLAPGAQNHLELTIKNNTLIFSGEINPWQDGE